MSPSPESPNTGVPGAAGCRGEDGAHEDPAQLLRSLPAAYRAAGRGCLAHAVALRNVLRALRHLCLVAECGTGAGPMWAEGGPGGQGWGLSPAGLSLLFGLASDCSSQVLPFLRGIQGPPLPSVRFRGTHFFMHVRLGSPSGPM